MEIDWSDAQWKCFTKAALTKKKKRHQIINYTAYKLNSILS